MRWDDLRFFLALRESGSVKGAARATGVDHSTVSRRLAALEDALGGPLFDRTPDGLVPTEAGEAIAPMAEQMALLATEVAETVQAAHGSMAGTVHIATSPILATEFLVPQLPELRARFPEVEFVTKASIEFVDVSRREADIAVRTHPAGVVRENPSEIARKAGTFGFALYASESYLRERGRPEPPIRGLDGHGMVVASEDGPGARWNRSLDPPAEQVMVAYPYASTMAAVASGMGMALLPCLMADRSKLVRVSEVLLSWNLWVVTSERARHNIRLQRVKDALVDILHRDAHVLGGSSG